MSTRFSASQICELALQRIGAFSINDSAADGASITRALYWLDMVMGALAGETRIFWLVPTTVSIPIETDVIAYAIMDDASNAPDLGVQFPISATLLDASGLETPLDIITRTDYEQIDDKDESGTPERIYIDRLNEPTMKVHPVPTSDDYTVKLVVQSYAPEFVDDANRATELRQAWQLWAVKAVAAEIGAGPVRKLPRQEIKDLMTEAEDLKRKLLAFENRQHARRSQRVAAKDF